MGIGPGFFQKLLELKQTGNLQDIDSVAEVGNQQLSHEVLSSAVLSRFVKEFGSVDFVSSAIKSREGKLVHGGMRHQELDQPNSRIVWKEIGARYTGFDMDDEPDTVKLDLNFDEVPEAHRSKYGLVTNLGTTEHVVNQFNAFKAAHDLCRPGGIMLHELPAGGYADHGFFNYNPKFFWQLAKANNYHLIDLNLNAGNTYRVFEGLFQFFQTRSEFPWRVRQIFGSDVGVTAILAKRHDEPFRAPLDVGDFGEDPSASPKMRETYPSYFGSSTFWTQKPVFGPAFHEILRHYVDEVSLLATAKGMGDDVLERILALSVPGGRSHAQMISMYLDQVNDILVEGYRQSGPARLEGAEIDLGKNDFVGLEWGMRMENALDQRWRYLGPRDRSFVLLTLKEGLDYVARFVVLDIKPNLRETLRVACNESVLDTAVEAHEDGLHFIARIPAKVIAADPDVSRIGLISVGSPNADRPGNSLTDVPPNRASLTGMHVRRADRKT